MIKTTFLGITISAIAVAAVLGGFAFTQTQMFSDTTSSIETENDSYDLQTGNSITSAVATLEEEGLHIHLFIDGEGLVPVPDAWADDPKKPVKTFTLIADEDEGQTVLSTLEKIHFMNFNGVYPAPTIRVTQGDVVQITVENRGDNIHSIDIHAGQLSAIPNFLCIESAVSPDAFPPPVATPPYADCAAAVEPVPADTRTVTFVAVNAGVFAYHCEANNVFGLDEHALQGMSGMVIVDPEDGYKKLKTLQPDEDGDGIEEVEYKPLAREFQLLAAEWYLATEEGGHPPSSDPEDLPGAPVGDGVTPRPTPAHTEHDFAQAKMFSNDPSYTHINGIPFGYLGPLLATPPWSTSVLLSDVANVPNLDGVDPPVGALTLDLPEFFTTTEDPGRGLTLPGAGPLGLIIDPLIPNFPPDKPIATHLEVKAGEHVRLFVQNNGDRLMSFHIVGEALDRVAVGNNILAHGVQTWGIPAYADATIDVIFEEPGVYVMVNHDYSMLFKGQAIVFVALESGEPLNPSNAIPPESDLKKTSISSATCDYGIGPDGIWGTADDDTFVHNCPL